MQLSYTFWTAKEGGYVGYINRYPDYWTQGGDVEELEGMLASLYRDIVIDSAVGVMYLYNKVLRCADAVDDGCNRSVR